MKTKKELFEVSTGVSIQLTVDVIDYEELDTFVELVGSFWVAGNKRKEFCEKLSELVNSYRI